MTYMLHIYWHWYCEGPLKPCDFQSYLLNMFKREPFRLQGRRQLGVLHRDSEASARGFPDEDAQQREVEGETEEVSGKRERIGMEKCKGKKLTK